MRQITGVTVLLIIVIQSCSISSSLIRKQRVVVKGRLLCGEQPAAGVLVKLVDEDTGPDPDELMDEDKTNEHGEFILDGTESEFTNIDPYLKIFHDCNDGRKPCQRKWKIKISDNYINRADDQVVKILDIGTWNLEAVLMTESKHCYS